MQMSTLELSATRKLVSRRNVLLIAAALILSIALREHLAASLWFAATNLWDVTPIVLAGLLITAILTASGSINILVDMFDGRELLAVVMVSLIGAVLPVCGITLLPLVIGLLSAGVPLAPVMAFLLSSAVTDPSMFAVTVATLGLPLALGKTIAALGIGVLGGAVTLLAVRAGRFNNPTRRSSMLDSLTAKSACCSPTQVEWQFWQDPARLALFKRTCTSVAKLVVLWLGAAFVAEYFLKLYLPQDSLAAFVGQDNPFSVPIAAIVGAPLYLDGYAALPFVRGLIDRGMADGAALAFLVAGGITSAWAAIPVFALFRLPVFCTYISLAISGSILAGWGYAWVLVGLA